jgi:hypothetical protein
MAENREVQLHLFLASVLDGVKLLDLRSHRFARREIRMALFCSRKNTG